MLGTEEIEITPAVPGYVIPDGTDEPGIVINGTDEPGEPGDIVGTESPGAGGEDEESTLEESPGLEGGSSEGIAPTMEAEPSPSAQAEDSAEDDGGSVCIPGTGIVEVAGAGRVLMREVRIGDRVRVSHGRFSEVMLWTHYEPGYMGRRFVRVGLQGDRSLTVSEGHMVWQWRCEGCEREGVEVGDVRVGVWMWVVGEGLKRVETVERGVWAHGLFNAQTAAGDIVVDDVVVSCYTKWVPMGAAHGLLAPVRAAIAAWGIVSWG